jgi:hypothetical protein
VKEDLTQYKYGSALIPQNTIICGVRLKPFCLGHLMLLEELNNPLIAETEKDINLVDGTYHLYCALLICGLTYEEGVELCSNERLFNETLSDFQNNLMLNIAAEPDWNIFSKVNLFKQYLGYYVDMPIYEELQSRGDSSPSGTDWKTSIFTTFKKTYTETQILNMPLRKLFYEWSAIGESDGAIKTFNKYQYESLIALQKRK